MHEVDWHKKVTFEMHELPELLSLAGHEVDFLDFPENAQRTGFRRFLDFKTETVVRTSRTYEGSRVNVITPGRIFAPPLDRLLATVSFVPTLWRLLKKQKHDLVVLYAVPTNGWQTILLARLSHTPVLFRGLDVSHEIRRSVFRPLIKMAERFIYRQADWLSLNNRELLEYCVRTGAPREKCSVDFAGVFSGQFESDREKEDLLDQHQISADKVVVCYLGTLFEFCGLVRIVKELSISPFREKIILVIAGDGPLQRLLVHEVERLQLKESVRLLGRVGFDEVRNIFRIANFALVPFDIGPVTDYAFPWKAVQYLSAGLPVIASELSGLKSVFAEGKGVTYVETSEGFLDRVGVLIEQPVRVHEIIENGQRVVNDCFMWNTNVHKFERLFERIVSEHEDQV